MPTPEGNVMAKLLYESEYKKTGHFSFGQNWRNYLKTVNPDRIKIAEASLEQFLGKKGLEKKTFVDIGCGSSLFSLAAHRLGASRVVSIDVDEASLGCAEFLQKKAGRPPGWEIKAGSVLNKSFLNTLGQYDIVYSWGVLHHTGDVFQAMKNTVSLVKPKGKLFISIYNDYKGGIHGKSTFWLKVKKNYNNSSPFIKKVYFALYCTYLLFGLCLSLKNPISYIYSYQSARGMSWKHDILDWLGGFPYEYATPEKIVSFLADLGFTPKKIHVVNSIGCNEYVFERNKEIELLPKVTVLMSAHNGGKTIEKTLKTVFNQTLVPQLVCVNDASTDETMTILNKWKKKMGNKMIIIENKKNLGLTKSLNRGLAEISTPLTARIDADDWWDAAKLEKQVNFLVTNPEYGIIGSWYKNYHHHKESTHEPPMRDEVIRNSIIQKNPFAHSSVVFNTRLIKSLGGYDEKVRYGQDYELWLRCLPKTKFFNFPQYLCHRSFTGGVSIEKQREQMQYALQTRLKYIRKYRLSIRSYSSLIEPFLISLIPRWIADLKRKLSDRAS